jgi:hypothetical protein
VVALEANERWERLAAELREENARLRVENVLVDDVGGAVASPDVELGELGGICDRGVSWEAVVCLPV